MARLLVVAEMAAALTDCIVMAHKEVVTDIAGLEEPCALILRGRRVQQLCLRRAGHTLLTDQQKTLIEMSSLCIPSNRTWSTPPLRSKTCRGIFPVTWDCRKILTTAWTPSSICRLTTASSGIRGNCSISQRRPRSRKDFSIYATKVLLPLLE